MNIYHDSSLNMLVQHQQLDMSGLEDGGAGDPGASASEGDKSLSHFLALANSLDSQTILHAVSPKLFDHFTLWDLMLAKAKQNEESGALGTIVNDTALILCELKILVESCLNPILVGKVAIKKKSEECIEFDDMMTMAMGLDTNLWLKRRSEDISYRHNMLNVENLFPPKQESGVIGRPVKIKKEVVEEPQVVHEEDEDEEDDDEDEEEDEAEAIMAAAEEAESAALRNESVGGGQEDGRNAVDGDEEDDEGGNNGHDEEEEGAKDDDDPEYKPAVSSASAPTRSTRRIKIKTKKMAEAERAAAARAKKRKRRTKSEMKVEKKEGKFNCAKCGKNYLNFTAWYKHMEKTCASRASLRISIRTVGDQFFCAFRGCQTAKKAFASKDDVHDHWALNHVEDEQKIVPCFLCELKFATIGAKKVHMTKVHVKENPLLKKKKKQVEVEVDEDGKGGAGSAASKEKHLCLKCGQSMNKESGKKHEEKCNGMFVRRPEYRKVEDEYFCTVNGCNIGYGFNSMYGLRKHFHGKHTREEEKFFNCDYCDEKFSFKTTRNKHITEKHMRNHVCDICGKGFGGRSKMMQHRFLHTGEKPYACNKCDYRAAKRSNLEAHLESKHSVFQQKNFICAICNKQFVTMGRVRRHMSEIHADGADDGGSSTRKKKRIRAPPLPVPMPEEDEDEQQQQESVELMQVEKRGVVKRVIIPQQQQHMQELHHVVEQDEEAVHYLQSELVHNPNETQIITVRPMY